MALRQERTHLTQTQKVNTMATKAAQSIPSIDNLKKAEAIATLAAHYLGQGIAVAQALKQAEEYWTLNKSSVRSSGFTANLYSRLESGPMSDEDFNNLIDAGSKNVQAHKSYYNGVREMANKIWANK
jgi:hypothetical protein